MDSEAATQFDNRPIGIFDSGIGGLTIAKEIAALLPHEHIVYFADTANCPYGPKPREEIVRLARQAVNRLLDEGAKLIVIACNTATTAAVRTLRAEFDLPIVGTEPAVKPAVTHTRTGVVGVLATQATVESEQLRRLCRQFGPGTKVLNRAGSGLVELAEQGRTETEEAVRLLTRYIEPMIAEGADQIVLGCTHYPFFLSTIRRIIGKRSVTVVNPAPAIARQTRRVLEEQGLAADPQREGGIVFRSSLEGSCEQEIAERFQRYSVEYSE